MNVNPVPAHQLLCNRRPGVWAGQSGQALAEGVVVMAALLLLWVLSGWLLKMQDLALQVSNASRYAAFDLARYADINRIQFPVPPKAYFTGSGQHWTDLRGRSWLMDERQVTIKGTMGTPLPFGAQPGQSNVLSSTLRGQWALADTGVREVIVMATPKTGIENQPNQIRRQAFIAVNTGFASDDDNVVERIRASELAWAGNERASNGAGKLVAARLMPVDAAWSRPEPEFDWLGPWRQSVPVHHLQSYIPTNIQLPGLAGMPQHSSEEAP
jgi:hypothetical protein